jgi:hypothetical protein
MASQLKVTQLPRRIDSEKSITCRGGEVFKVRAYFLREVRATFGARVGFGAVKSGGY